MSEVDWGTEDNQAKPKKRIPTWVWIGGGCCGVALLAVIALTAGGIFLGHKMMDQEANWKSLSEQVEFDPEAKRADAMIVGNPMATMQPGIEGLWQITSKSNAWQASVIRFGGNSADEMRKAAFTEEHAPQLAQMVAAFSENDVELGTIEVQGRTLRVRRFATAKADAVEPPAKPEDEHKSKSVFGEISKAFKKGVVMVDITPDGQAGLLLFAYTRLGDVSRIPDEVVVDFLKPYHIGPNR
jgi:hypothetical protein